jgi:hypothetical protein
MNSWQEKVLDSISHRGCGIRAASYALGPQAWLPEACMWLETESGLRRLWVRSFAHCFDAEKLTFPNKLDADNWALSAARMIIDRALEQFASKAAPDERVPAKSFTAAWKVACHPVLALLRLKNFRSSR